MVRFGKILTDPISVMVAVPGFTPVAWLGFMLLGFGVLIHLTVVNIVLGMSIIVPLTEFISYKRKDKDMERLAKRLFRYLALADIVAGVFGTYVAVILAAFWPKLLYTFSTIFLGPIVVALIGIFAAIPSIAMYWYGWDRLPKKIHLGTGVLMAIGALLVPAGFRVLFAFIDNPATFNVTVSATSLTGSINLATILTNPIYTTLLLHSWFGGLTMATLFAAGAFGWVLRGNMSGSNLVPEETEGGRRIGAKSTSRLVAGITDGSTAKGTSKTDVLSKELEISRDSKFMKYLLNLGIGFLVIQSIIGVAYFLVIKKYVPYVYAAITGNTSIAAYNFGWIFIPFLALVSTMWVSSLILFFQSRHTKTLRPPRWASFVLMLSTAAALPLGEAMNDASRAPYMILTGKTGLPANIFTNTAIPVTWPIAIAAVFVGAVTITFLLGTLYFVFSHGRQIE